MTENGNTSFYTNKEAEKEISDVNYQHSFSISVADPEHLASGHIPFPPGSSLHNPANALYNFSNISFQVFLRYT